MLDDLLLQETKKDQCKGRLYRYSISSFQNSNGHWITKEQLRFLKKKSCPGCEKCGYLEEMLQDYIYNNSNVRLFFDEEPFHGEIYELKITNVSVDYETGFADDWDVTFVRVKE